MMMALLYAPRRFPAGADDRQHLGLGHRLQRRQCRLPDRRRCSGSKGSTPGRDWRGPIADRMLISSADGGNAINDAVRVSACGSSIWGASLRASRRWRRPRRARSSISRCPGSVQGFWPQATGAGARSRVEQRRVRRRPGALQIRYEGLGAEPAAVLTPTFAPPEVARMRTYELMATPLRLFRGRWSARA